MVPLMVCAEREGWIQIMVRLVYEYWYNFNVCLKATYVLSSLYPIVAPYWSYDPLD